MNKILEYLLLITTILSIAFVFGRTLETVRSIKEYNQQVELKNQSDSKK